MNFPQNFSSNGRGQPPIIGQQQVPCVTFQIQVTTELMTALSEYAEMTGLDGTSLMNHVFTRGLIALRQDFQNAKIEAAELADEPDDEEEGETAQ